MEYTKLGRSTMSVSKICLGTMHFGPKATEEESHQILDRALDMGINFIDTANVYGRGKAESFLGEVLSGRERSSYILATKLYFPMSKTDRGLSRGQVLKQIDLSLERLRTDYVDLYQCHRYDERTPLEETMEALSEVVRAGKSRYIGFSEWRAEQIQAALELPGSEKFVSSQPQYSLLWRKPERDVFPLCARNGISQIVWSPLAQGVLTGKYRPGDPPPAGSRATSEAMGGFMDRFTSRPVLEAVERLRAVAEQAGLTLPQFALAWVLREPNVASAIVGASRPAQVEANASASGITLSEDTLRAADEALGDAVVR